ncbi:PqqD family protein [Paenibacillus sp. PL91]|uniref:PqqD family protein n=1 Tax=Paenibacillus sp. PL91 TaxID=2729538 RepID=UPI00145D7FF0|nr:PqqD family protein [Paenibacillus sp. PL91]MBC9199333.1 PqqD family protein [Paenibacillus sp. PL91]
MTILANQTLLRRENVESAELDGEWLLLNIETHGITKVNELGGYIWSILPEYPTVAQLAEKIHTEYGVEMEVVSADVQAFVKMLLEAGLLRNE